MKQKEKSFSNKTSIIGSNRNSVLSPREPDNKKHSPRVTPMSPLA